MSFENTVYYSPPVWAGVLFVTSYAWVNHRSSIPGIGVLWPSGIDNKEGGVRWLEPTTTSQKKLLPEYPLLQLLLDIVTFLDPPIEITAKIDRKACVPKYTILCCKYTIT